LSLQASTYQAVSGAGIGGPAELQQQILALSRGEAYPPQVFAHQIAYNLIPQIGQEQELGYTTEEMKLQYEGRKILHLPEFTASCTCVRVPVMRSHSVSACICFEGPVSVADAREILSDAPGCRLLDDLAAGQYPMPLTASDQDLVLVGRLRPDLTDEKRLHLWCCGDQLRKGAATNAIQIAELLIQ
jgi:aspartate-semialdehyde dehydrogenase